MSRTLETPTGTSARATSRPVLILIAVALAQLTVVLDGTIVSVALPQMQRELGLADTDRQWVVSIYALTFGAMLLLGGRVADLWGRKRAFLLGMAGFAAASALGGASTGVAALLIARAGQGLFAALLAPAALSVLTVTFAEGRQRARAFSVFGAVSAGGAAVGLVLGGFLTEYLDWRWCFFVNVPIAAVVIVLGLVGLRESRTEGRTALDVWGAVVAALGLGAVVYGFAEAEKGWGTPLAVPSIIVGAVLLAVFVLIERRHRAPVLPLSIPADRKRAVALIGLLLSGAAMVGGILQVMFYLQSTLGLTPLLAGLGVLPLTAGVAAAGALTGVFLPRLGAKRFSLVGVALGVVGYAGLTMIGSDTSYFSHVLPWLFVVGLGLGAMLIPMQSTALTGVPARDAGAASALTNATQQVGGALGTAVFSAIAAAGGAAGAVGGYSAAFTGVAIMLALYGVVVLFALRRADASSH